VPPRFTLAIYSAISRNTPPKHSQVGSPSHKVPTPYLTPYPANVGVFGRTRQRMKVPLPNTSRTSADACGLLAVKSALPDHFPDRFLNSNSNWCEMGPRVAF
jgi:hypothetical protein